MVGRGGAVVGTPDDALAYLERYWDKTGGFGTALLQTINWAPFEESKRSYELFMRYVVPRFAGRLKIQEENYAWLRANTAKFSAQAGAASQQATKKRLGRDGKSGQPHFSRTVPIRRLGRHGKCGCPDFPPRAVRAAGSPARGWQPRPHQLALLDAGARRAARPC